MAYTTATMNLVSSTLEGSTGTKHWRYTGTDSLATVLGAGYVSDATKKGMLAGDMITYDKTDTVSCYQLKVASLSSGAATLKGMDVAASGNINLGSTTSDTLSVFGTTAVSQIAVGSSVTTTAATTTTPFGFSTVTQANGIVTLLNSVLAALKSYGLSS